MFHVITGGSGSGKSAYAETCAVQYHQTNKAGALYYIATMQPFEEEAVRKIERHRTMRAGKGFKTIECYTGLENVTQNICAVSAPDALLECMSNLVANELFRDVENDEYSGADWKDQVERRVEEDIIRGIRNLCQICENVVVVTNEVCQECARDTDEMKRYKRVLSSIGRRMVQMADRVTEVVYGIPIQLKPLEREPERTTGMRIVIGGAYQGKQDWVNAHYGVTQWADGRKCDSDELYTCEGIVHFQEYVKRLMKYEEDTGQKSVCSLARALIKANPNIVIVSDEIGCGLVPMDEFDRKYREQTGRICTELAAYASQVVRVTLGIGYVIKGQEEEI